MAPIATVKPEENGEIDQVLEKLANLKPLGHGLAKSHSKIESSKDWINEVPESTKRRFERAGIDISSGYPSFPKNEDIPKFLDEAYGVRGQEVPYIARGKNADPEKKALLGSAKKVINLTKHIGTEIVGLQLSKLNEQQLDELALLVAERVVVFFRDQDLSPQKQLSIGEFFGSQIERHPQAPQVPLPENEKRGTSSGISVIWRKFFRDYYGFQSGFRQKRNGWHTDLVHELQPAGITHLHNDAIPKTGGDTAWASGYAAYDKLSPALQEFLDGKTAIYRSAHQYIDRENPLKGPKYIEREHPIVRTHPVTGWKSLFVNRSMTKSIVGVEPEESRVLLEFLFGVFEKNLDIQVRFRWQPTQEGFGTSAIWDNRISQHFAIEDYDLESDDRHGTRVTSLAEIPYFDKESKSQREALGLSLN